MGVQRDVIPLAEGERGGQRPPKQQSGQQSVSGRTPRISYPGLTGTITSASREAVGGLPYDIAVIRRYF